MKLELKESNSPYWLLGLKNGNITCGSSTNIPCYYKSSRKWYELAKPIINQPGIDEVYLVTGVVWDNMKGSWSAKEAGSYIQNKGRLILSKNEVTSYEEKYIPVESDEDFPKDMSKDPLPKKVKTYTSSATALEGDKKMRLELKDDEKLLDEGATEKHLSVGTQFDNAGERFEVIDQNDDDALLVAINKETGEHKNRYVITWGLKSDGSWNQGHYFTNEKDATEFFNERAKKTESLKESKIVEPIGNPQTAGSFVNIDIDLDHMEVSDFIIRLTQAIRSEQNAILEYTALRSANGITNEERTNIDSIIEEEKNHMTAITTMLYKQILSNHTENVDKANDEFILPKFGANLFDEKSNLKESVENIVAKIEASVRMSDEFFIGNREDGRIYHGLAQAIDTVKDIISTSGDEVVIQNITLGNKLAEDTKITEQNDKYNVEIDVEYDSEVVNQIFDNLARVIGDFNKNSDIKLTDLNLKDGKFYFTTNKEVDEKFVEDTCKKLFDEATNYEYQINIK